MSGYDEALLKRARALHDAPNVTMDGHNDCLGAARRLRPPPRQFDLREPQGHIKIPKLRLQYLHIDFPRCKKGGLTAQFWSVYVPTTIAAARQCIRSHCVDAVGCYTKSWTTSRIDATPRDAVPP